jgi:hypothetical protein
VIVITLSFVPASPSASAQYVKSPELVRRRTAFFGMHAGLFGLFA